MIACRAWAVRCCPRCGCVTRVQPGAIECAMLDVAPGMPLRPATTRRRLVVVLNPCTSRYTATGLEALLRSELDAHYTIQLIETRPDGPTTEELVALAEDAYAVLACGGDGTVNAVAAALVGGDVPLAILPAGTTNIIAQGLGIRWRSIAARWCWSSLPGGRQQPADEHGMRSPCHRRRESRRALLRRWHRWRGRRRARRRRWRWRSSRRGRPTSRGS